MAAASSCRLEPIEALAREREVRGYDVIHELQHILKRAALKPTSCKTALPGPDTIFIQDSPAAIEFLLECGFAKTDEVAEVRNDPHSASASRSISPPPHRLSSSSNMNAQEAPTRTEASPNPTTPTSSSPAPPARQGAVIYLPRVPDEQSSNWDLMKAEFGKALELLQWALSCDTGMLTVKVHRLTMFNTPIYTQDIRVQVIVEWKDELGQGRSERYVTPFCGHDVTHPTTVPLSGDALQGGAPVPVEAVGKKKGSSSKDGGDSGGVAPYAILYSGLHASFPTICDRPCFVSVHVSKKRDYLSGEKVKGTGIIGIANTSCVLQAIDLKDPNRDGGLPVGRITIEVDSVRLRCKAITSSSPSTQRAEPSPAAATQSVAQKEMTAGGNEEDVVQQQQEEGGGMDEGGNVVTTPSPVSDSKVWIEQEKLRELSQKAKEEKQRVYDADDYF